MTDRTTAGTAWTVGAVAEAFGVTVRTLHHYDAIGLLRPGGRSPAGYRLYSAADLERLQQVVVYRRLAMSLEDIAALLDGGEDVVGHLRRQRATVLSRLDELNELVRAIEKALEKEMRNEKMSTAEMRELFGDSFDESHQDEAEQRWGQTTAWAQSQQRTAGYTRADWTAVKSEMDAVNQAFLAAMEAGEPATGERAAAAAERHRAGIERFYDCDYTMQRALADMYLADPRFTKTYDDLRPGLARYVHDAIHANADRRP